MFSKAPDRPRAAASSGIVTRLRVDVRRGLAFCALLTLLVSPWAPAFAAGNLLVRLTDGVSGQVLANTNVVVWEVLSTGELVYRASRLTDALGQVQFVIAGLGDGRRFAVRTKPYLDTVERQVTAAGTLDLVAGSLQLRLVNGVTGVALAGLSATLMAVRTDGSVTVVKSYVTDPAGMLKLDPPGVGPRLYRIRAASPVDGVNTLSGSFPEKGKHTVAIGNGPLTVRVVDHLNGQPLQGQSVQAQEILADGSRITRRTQYTDADGRVVMDLEGLGQGKRYALRVRPFVQWVERQVTAPGALELRVGALTVTLLDQDLNKPLAGKSLQLQRKLPTGQLVGLATGTTNTSGKVRFDPAETPSEEAVHMFATTGPFGGTQRYLSQPVVQLGAVTFPVRRAGPEDVDLRPPSVEVVTAGTTAKVGTKGFTLLGYATDERRLRDVQVELRGPRGEIQTATAVYDPDSTRWTLHQVPAWFRAGDTVRVKVRARDQFYNAVGLELSLQVVNDLDLPVIQVKSHAGGQQIHDRGVLIIGTTRDTTEVSRFTATVQSGTELVKAERSVELVPGTGQWALALPAEILTGRTAVRVQLRATDSSGNSALQNLDLGVAATANPLPHLVARTSFGETPASLAGARALGYTGYLARQLAPMAIDDSGLEARLAAVPLEKIGDLRAQLLLRAVYSERQLQELMTWFWENHFNTDIARHGNVAWEAAENQAFRANALGRFRNLLGISAKSPAMLYYLDGFRNIARDPNENYARELLELHTLGVAAGYTQADIDAAARAFTGWTVQSDRFYFDPDVHDSGPKTVLGVALSGAGIQEGEQVLDILAQHRSTARRVCSKLAAALLTDAPPETLVGTCATVFLNNANAPDQMGRVVSALANSTEFKAGRYRHAKMKTPIRFLAGVARSVGASGNSSNMAADLVTLGQTPFGFATPTGYSVVAEDWASGDLVWARMALVGRMLESRPGAAPLYLAVGGLLEEPTLVRTAEGIAGYLLMRVYNEDFDGEELGTALSVLSEKGLVRFDMRAAAADARLTRLLRTLLSLPRYQLY